MNFKLWARNAAVTPVILFIRIPAAFFFIAGHGIVDLAEIVLDHTPAWRRN